MMIDSQTTKYSVTKSNKIRKSVNYKDKNIRTKDMTPIKEFHYAILNTKNTMLLSSSNHIVR